MEVDVPAFYGATELGLTEYRGTGHTWDGSVCGKQGVCFYEWIFDDCPYDQTCG